MSRMKKTLGKIGLALEQLPDARERANHKAKELAKLVFSGRQRAGDFEVEIHDLKEIPGGIEYYARAWVANDGQVGFGRDGSVDLERFRVFNHPIMVPDGTKSVITNERGIQIE